MRLVRAVSEMKELAKEIKEMIDKIEEREEDIVWLEEKRLYLEGKLAEWDKRIENLEIIVQRIYEHCMRHYGGVSEKNAFVEDVINIINGHEAYDVPTAIERIEKLEETLDKRHDIIRKMKGWMKERTFDWQEQSIWKDFLTDHEDDELIRMMREDGE